MFDTGKMLADFRGMRLAKKTAIVVLSLFSVTCWLRVVSFEGASFDVLTITGCLVLAAVLLLILWRMTRRHDEWTRESAVMGALLSSAIVFGWRVTSSGCVYDISAMGDACLSSPSTYVLIAGLFPVAFCGFSLLFNVLDRYADRGLRGSDNERCVLRLGKRVVPNTMLTPLLSVVVFAFWVPVLLAMFPGVNGYDSALQAEMFLSSEINSHHPVIHTLLVGACIEIGMRISSVSAGILLYSIVQMLIMSFIYGFACKTIFECTRSKGILAFSLAWFSLCPLNSVLSISMTKDSLFGALIVLAMAYFARYYCLGRRSADKVLLVVSLSIALLFRNNALYAYVLILIVAAFALCFRKKKISFGIAVSALIPLVICVAVTGPVYSALGIEKGNAAAESLSVPIQQLARTAVVADDLSAEDKEMIDALLPDWESYQAGISDHVKGTFNVDYFRENLPEIVLRYFMIGVTHPQVFTEAFLVCTYGYWYPDSPGMDRGGFSYHPYFETPATLQPVGIMDGIDHSSLIGGIGAAYETMVVAHIWEYVPVVAALMNSGMAVWFYLIAFVWFAKRSPAPLFLMPTGLLIAYWGTCLLGPCLLVRYLYPLFAALPLLFAFVMLGKGCWQEGVKRQAR